MSDLQGILEIIIAKCEDEIEEYNKNKTFERLQRKEVAKYIVDFANEALATHTKMLRRGDTNE